MNASTAFSTARSLMNDLSDYIWTDNILLPFLVQGFRELEDELRACDAPVMKALEVETVPAATTVKILLCSITIGSEFKEKRSFNSR